jgi:hypothetical protein
MRVIRLITVAFVTGSLSSAALAAPQLDAKGKCRDGGKFVAAEKCKAPTAAPKSGKCRDAKGHFAKCGAPGAKPA